MTAVEIRNDFSRTRSVISRRATRRIASRPPTAGISPRVAPPPRGTGPSAWAARAEVRDRAGGAGGVEHAPRGRRRSRAAEHAARARLDASAPGSRSSQRAVAVALEAHAHVLAGRPRSRSSSTGPVATSRPSLMIATASHRRSTSSSWCDGEHAPARRARRTPSTPLSTSTPTGSSPENGSSSTSSSGSCTSAARELHALLVAQRERLTRSPARSLEPEPLDPARRPRPAAAAPSPCSRAR